MPNSADHSPLRKAAILVDSLDRQSAERLLNHLPTAMAEAVSRAAKQMGPIDPVERCRIVDEFKQNSSLGPSLDIADEVSFSFDHSLSEKQEDQQYNASSLPSHAMPQPERSHTYDTTHSPIARHDSYHSSDLSAYDRPAPPFQDQVKPADPTSTSEFLPDASANDLADHLRHEHPQTVAVVISRLSPTRAAALLSELPEELTTEAVQRLIDLEEADVEVLSTIETHLQQELHTANQRRQRRQAGVTALGEILEAARHHNNNHLLRQLQAQAPALVSQIGIETPHQAQATQAEGVVSSAWKSQHALSAIANDGLSLQREEAPSPFPSQPTDQLPSRATNLPTNPPATPPTNRTKNALAKKPFDDFDKLVTLSDQSLAKVLQQVDAEVLRLALTAASAELLERITRQLTPFEARRLHQQITETGPLLLRDVDAAQRVVCRVADQLLSENTPADLASAVATG